MNELENKISDQETVTLSLNQKTVEIVNKLISWGKFVAVLNILQGSLLALTVFVFLLPTAAIGLFYILMGVKLISSANHFQITLQAKDEQSLINALNDMKSYIQYFGIIYIINAVMLTVLLLIILFIGSAFMEYFFDAFDDFVTNSTTLIQAKFN